MSSRAQFAGMFVRSTRLLLLLAGGALLRPQPLLAHGKLLGSSPAAGSKLTEAPKTVRLDFNESAELSLTRISVVTASGDTIQLLTLRHPAGTSKSVTADVPVDLPAGEFRILWRMAGADGHPTHGEFAFSIVPANEPAVDTSVSRDTVITGGRRSAPPAPESGGFGVESPIYVVIRWLEFCALLTVIGAVGFRNAVLPRIRSRKGRVRDSDRSERRAAAWGRNAAIVLAVTAPLRLAAQAAVMRSAQTPMAMHGRAFFDTAWGRAWALQLIAAIIAAGVFARAASLSDRKSSRSMWRLATAAALLLAVTPALSGHAMASQWAGVAIVVDALHVMGAGGWLGTLLLTLAVGLREIDPESLGAGAAELFNAFSPVALTFAGLVAATGFISGWINLGSLPPLVTSSYGKVLLIKLALVAFVVSAGAWNWKRMRPSLIAATSTAPIRRSASIEIALGIVVVLVTAVLVAVPTPMSE
jgi:putative copper export protein/methionine-rich copper-binding protein CopC